MTLINMRLFSARLEVMTFIKTALFFVVLVAVAPGPGSVSGTTNRKERDHALRDALHFWPLMSIDIPGLGTATNLEAVGTTQNMKGEKMLDKMSARCAALSVASGGKY